MEPPKMPEELRSRVEEITALTDAFCNQYLGADYRGLCTKMVELLARVRAPVETGQATGWAAGIVYTVGWVNFLTDPDQTPHLRAADIANGFGVSQGTMMARSKVIREALGVHDRGQTWPEYLDVLDDYREGVINWEVSLRPMPDGRLLAVTWSFHEPSGQTRPTRWTVSWDGRHFGVAHPTGFLAQTCKILPLGGDAVLCVYRRNDQPGLWATLAELRGQHWTNLQEVLLWRGAGSGMTGRSANSDELCALRFGYPSPVLRRDGTVLVAFWCREDDVNNIRWVQLSVR
jgi:hypothetical protein